MSAYDKPTTKIAGFSQSIRSNDKTRQVAEVSGIPYGMPVFVYPGNDLSAYTYHDNVATVTYTGDFVSLNVINMTVNDVAIAPVTFDTTHDATMILLLAAIEAAITGATATSNTGGSNNVVTITIEDGVDRVVTSVVTLGGGQVTATAAYTSTMVFDGFSRFEQQGEAEIKDVNDNVIVAGTSKLALGDAMAVVYDGTITAVVADAVVGTAQAYAVKDGANQGQVTDDSGSSNISLAGVTIQETTTAAGLADVRINK